MEREKFTRLMVEVHLTDALLAEGKRNSMGLTDRKNYSFYGELLGRYGLTRGQFDSCVDYYSRNTTLIEQIYKDVIDSLNKRLTVVKRELAKLRVNDTVNILPISDTVWVEGWAEDTVVTLNYHMYSYYNDWLNIPMAAPSEEVMISVSNSPEFQAMPLYPETGSVQIHDGRVIVKLAETYTPKLEYVIDYENRK